MTVTSKVAPEQWPYPDFWLLARTVEPLLTEVAFPFAVSDTQIVRGQNTNLLPSSHLGNKIFPSRARFAEDMPNTREKREHNMWCFHIPPRTWLDPSISC